VLSARSQGAETVSRRGEPHTRGEGTGHQTGGSKASKAAFLIDRYFFGISPAHSELVIVLWVRQLETVWYFIPSDAKPPFLHPDTHFQLQRWRSFVAIVLRASALTPPSPHLFQHRASSTQFSSLSPSGSHSYSSLSS